MNWKTASALAATMLILPFGINTVQAQQYNPGDSVMERLERNKEGKWGMRDGMTKLTEQLDLSSEQSQQIEAIREQSRSNSQALVQQLETNRQEMQSLLASDADPEQIQANHQDGQNLRQQLADIRLETMLEIREILTPEQRTQMAELMAQRRGRRFGDR